MTWSAWSIETSKQRCHSRVTVCFDADYMRDSWECPAGGGGTMYAPPLPPADSRDMQYKTYSSRQTQAAALWRCRGAEGAGGNNMVSSWIWTGNMVLTVRDSAGFKNKRTFIQYITSCGWFLTWRGKIDTIIYVHIKRRQTMMNLFTLMISSICLICVGWNGRRHECLTSPSACL